MEQETVMVKLKEGVVGPFPVKQLRRLSGFTPQTYVSYPGSDKWAPAYRVLSLNSYEPPAVALSNFFEPVIGNSSPRPFAFDWKPKGSTLGWVDRWFRRLTILNSILAIAAYAAWSYPPVRIPLEKELRIQAAVQWRKWSPIFKAHWTRPMTFQPARPSPAKNLRLSPR